MPIKYREEHRWGCVECGWVGTEEMKLRAPSPFDESQEILGCPTCKEVGNFVLVCDVEGCTANQVDGLVGRTVEGRYFWTCWWHGPNNPKNQEATEGSKG
jgi:hypothetical protein